MLSKNLGDNGLIQNHREKYSNIDEKYSNFLDYIRNTWLSGGIFEISEWNYHSAIYDDEEECHLISEKLHFTNNALEAANSVINSLIGSSISPVFFTVKAYL